MNLKSDLLFTDIDFCKPKVIQSQGYSISTCTYQFFWEVDRYLTKY